MLLAKTRKICEILSKKKGIGERDIYKETQGWEKRERDREEKRERGGKDIER